MDDNPGADGSVPEVPMVLIGNSSDVGWKYGKYCDPTNKSKVKCDFCGHISTGGIYRFKKHIVGVQNYNILWSIVCLDSLPCSCPFAFALNP
jgi:hypothetical protein